VPRLSHLTAGVSLLAIVPPLSRTVGLPIRAELVLLCYCIFGAWLGHLWVFLPGIVLLPGLFHAGCRTGSPRGSRTNRYSVALLADDLWLYLSVALANGPS